MPDLAATPTLVGGYSVRTPIPGNSTDGGAAFDGKGQALWIAVVNGQAQVWRTTAGWQSLLNADGSVSYLSTVTTDTTSLSTPTTCSLWRAGGNLFASVSGFKSTEQVTGHWLYRDTSTDKDGSGPWVLHSTISAASSPQFPTAQGWAATGEILVQGSRWATIATSWGYPTTGGAYAAVPAVATSDDSGMTWTLRLSYGWYNNAGASWFARNFGQFGGVWYVGGSGRGSGGTTIPHHWKSADLTTWTDLGSLDGSASEFPLSSPGTIFRYREGGSVLEAATVAPEELPAWTPALALPPWQFIHLANINNDAYPVWVAIYAGQVIGITASVARMPPCRQYPREDGLGTSSARRLYPPPRSRQGGFRQVGYY